MTDCKAKPDPNMSYCASQAAGCCDEADSACRSAPDANMVSEITLDCKNHQLTPFLVIL